MEYTFKIILLGNYSSGKSSILKRFNDDVFDNYYNSTIGVDFIRKRMFLDDDNDNNIYNLMIWDTAGQDKFNFIIKLYYRNISGAILVFDITNIDSFNNIITWYDSLYEHINSDHKKNIPLILVGNKCDLNKDRSVYLNDINLLINKLNCKYIECSAKDNINIDTIFIELIKEFMNKIKNGSIIINDTENGIRCNTNKKYVKRKSSLTTDKTCCIIN